MMINDLLNLLVGLGGNDPRKTEEKLSRGLERSRWVIYGAIILGVAALALAGVLLLLVP